jgi:hypothetical protein
MVISEPPRILQVEVSTTCNRRCGYCRSERARQQRPALIAGELYEKLVCENAGHIERVNLWGAGEPLLHPNLLGMVAFARGAGIPRVKLSTNGILLGPASARTLGLAGLTDLRVTIHRDQDGAWSPVALAHLRFLCAELKRVPRQIRVTAATVILDDARERYDRLAAVVAEMGADELELWPNMWRDELPMPRRPDGRRCTRLFDTITCLSDGSIIPCCFGYEHPAILGNVARQSSVAIWSSDGFRSLREAFRAGRLPSCFACNFGLSYPWSKT